MSDTTTTTAPQGDTATAAAPKTEGKPAEPTKATTTIVTDTGKPAEPAKPENAATGDKPQGPEGTDAVTYELKLPDGSPLDPTAVKAVEEFAKTNKLPANVAQEVLARESAAVASYVEGQQAQLKQKVGDWAKAVETDKELGGAAFAQSAEAARRVVDRFGSQELKDALNATGLGNHPELVRLLARIGKSMSDDSFVKPGAQPAPAKSLEEKFYPTMKSDKEQ